MYLCIMFTSLVCLSVCLCFSPVSCSLLKELTFMWGGRESMTWNYNGDQDDDLADDQMEGEGIIMVTRMIILLMI